MKKFFVAIFLLAAFAATSFAVEIPPNCRVANIQPGYCCWASLETLGRLHGISSLEGLVDSRSKESDVVVVVPGYGYYPDVYRVEPKNYGYDHALRAKLSSLKVKFWMKDSGNSDRTLLKYANSHGCLVGMKAGARGDGAHGIVLTHYDDKIIRFYDTNNPKDTWEGSRAWFDYYWSGMVIVVEK